MENHEPLTTRSTSLSTAEANPIVLRLTSRGRLVFKPLILANNPKDPSAFVKGVFAYQAKAPSKDWVDVGAIKLSTLKSGEGVRLELSSEETLELYKRLSDLYAVAEQQGVKLGTHQFVEAPTDPQLKSLIETGKFRRLQGPERVELLSQLVDWLDTTAAEALAGRLAELDPAQVAQFDAAFGAARLQKVLKEIESNLANADESYWQKLFEDNAWVLSQIYSEPLVIITGQAYVGGKAVTNKGGSLADFLLANPFTKNPVVAEIKTPDMPLLAAEPYRNQVYPSSKELTGAIAQAIHSADQLKENYLQLAGDETPTVRAFAPRSLLIAGSTHQITDRTRRSFVLNRRAIRGVDLVTFDEVAEKVRQLLELLEAPYRSSK